MPICMHVFRVDVTSNLTDGRLRLSIYFRITDKQPIVSIPVLARHCHLLAM